MNEKSRKPLLERRMITSRFIDLFRNITDNEKKENFVQNEIVEKDKEAKLKIAKINYFLLEE